MKKIILSLISALTIISFYFDKQIITGISIIKNNLLDITLTNIALISTIPIVLLATLIFLLKDKKIIIPLWITIFISYALSLLLKIAIKRPRPFSQNLINLPEILQHTKYNTWDFSFPSNHSMIVFCILPFIIYKYPKYKYLWIAFATITVFSRIYTGLHFLSDILTGGLIGYLIGDSIIKFSKSKKII